MTEGKTCIVASLVLLGLGCGTPAAPQPIVVGHVANLSGADKAGEHAAQGIRLALHHLDGAGLREALGGRGLQVRHADTRGLLDSYDAEAVRLAAVNRAVALIGGETADEVARLDRGSVPLLTLLGHAPAGLSSFAFYLGMQPRQQGETLARFVLEELHAKDVVLLSDERREMSEPCAEAFAQRYRLSSKGTVTPIRFGKESRRDELARRIEKSAAGALVFVGRARDLHDLRSELKNPPANTIFAGYDGDIQGLEDGVYLATVFAAGVKTEPAQTFVQEYKKAFKTEPTVQAALGYDALRLVADALKRSFTKLENDPQKDGATLRDALAEVQGFAGATGALTVQPGRTVRRPLHVARTAKGELVPLKVYEAEEQP